MHSVKTISALAGVKPETIRSWERRYSILTPARDGGGRRVYSDDDVDRLCLIAELVRSGHAISRLAELGDDELRALKTQDAPHAAESEEQRSARALLKAIEDYDPERFRMLVGATLTQYPPTVLADHVLSPTLRSIGNLWEQGKIDVGQEHTLSGIVRQLMLTAISIMQGSANGPRIAFTTLSGERHELGVLIACYVATAERFNCHYFGPDMPVPDLVRNIKKMDIRGLAVSLVHNTSETDPVEEVIQLARTLPEDVALWAGVGAHAASVTDRLPPRVMTFDAYAPFVRRLRTLEP